VQSVGFASVITAGFKLERMIQVGFEGLPMSFAYEPVQKSDF